jgi:hypothetical protein
MRTFEFIVVHHAASYDDDNSRVVHQSVAVVKRYHMLPKARYDAEGKLVKGTGGRGFLDIAYQRYIEVDGKVRLGRLDKKPGAHTEGFNDRSLGVCVSGHADFEPFNEAQLRSLVAQCAAWCRLYSLGADRVIGHREAPQYGAKAVRKSCPGKLTDMDAIRELVRAELTGGNRGVVLGDLARCDPEVSDHKPVATRRDGKPKTG